MYTPLGSSGPNSPNSNEPHESITLSACIIHAVNDLAPYPEGAKKDPFMYWDNDEDEISAAVALIKRYVIVIVPFVIFVMLCKNFMLRDNNYYTF